MGDRFYTQQKLANGGRTSTANTPKRKLKKDYIVPINEMLGIEVPGLDKLTIASLEALANAIQRSKNDN